MIKLEKHWRALCCVAAALVAATYPVGAQSSAVQCLAQSPITLPSVTQSPAAQCLAQSPITRPSVAQSPAAQSLAQSPITRPSVAQSSAAQFVAQAPSLSPVAQSLPAPQDSAVIYLARRGWHVDIGFAAADLKSPLKSLLDEFPGAQYLFFGFGDRRYLLAKNRNAPVLLAALWPGRGMILATGLTSPPSAAFGAAHVVTLAVAARQASDAQDFVWYSMDKQAESGQQGESGQQTRSGQQTGSGQQGESGQQTANRRVKSYGPGPYEGSLFFTATPNYSAFHTCNTWVAESLAVAALPIHSAGVIFAGQLWTQVRRLEKKQSAIARPMTNHPRASLQGMVQRPDHGQGGLLPSAQTTVVPEF